MEADKDKMMREYRAQLDAERARKLAQGKNHSSSKSKHKRGNCLSGQGFFFDLMNTTSLLYLLLLQIRRTKIQRNIAARSVRCIPHSLFIYSLVCLIDDLPAMILIE